MRKKENISSITAAKGERVLTMVTAYDALFAKLFEPYCDMILVGDSLNMSFAGKKDTLSATMDQMIYHTQAVCNGAKNSFIIFDMPFGSYFDEKSALENAARVYRETEADAIKIEGGADRAHIVRHLCRNNIAVVGHIGLLPQNVRGEGGYKVKGRDEKESESLIRDALAIEEAGAFCLVVEGVKAEIAAEITKKVSIPTIGIGAGPDTDGQVLVWSDMLGFFEEFKPKFVKRYLNGAQLVKEAMRNFNEEVKSRAFPSQEHTY